MPAFRIAARPAHPGLRLYPLLYSDPGCLGVVPVSFYPLPFLVATETWSSAELRGRPGGCTGRRQAAGHCLSTLSLQDNLCLFDIGLPSAWQGSESVFCAFLQQEMVTGCKAQAAEIPQDIATKNRKGQEKLE